MRCLGLNIGLYFFRSLSSKVRPELRTVSLQHDGTITEMVMESPKVACSLDFLKFPFDLQTCDIRMGQLDYGPGTLSTQLNDWDLAWFTENSQWSLEAIQVQRILKNHFVIKFPLRRRSSFHLLNVILPTFLLSLITLAGFWIPPDQGERISLGMSNCLAFVVFMLLLVDQLPSSSNAAPAFGKFVLR